MCETLHDRVAGGALPPDDAYWWTRIAGCAAITMLEPTP